MRFDSRHLWLVLLIMFLSPSGHAVGPLEVIVLPPVSDHSTVEIAIDLEPALKGVTSDSGFIDLFAIQDDGRLRSLASGIPAKSGVHRYSVDWLPGDIAAEARWRSNLGEILAKAQSERATVVGGALSHAKGSGESWFPVTNTRHTDLTGNTRAALWWNDGTGERLVIGGDFTQPGRAENIYLMQWDGVGWSPLGGPLNGTVRALAVDPDGHLLVGGDFDVTGASAARHLARWDGSSWTEVGGGTNGSVRAIEVDTNGLMFVGGMFSAVGGQPAANIAAWNGSSWDTMDGGVTGAVHALLATPGEDLVVGGSFPDTTNGDGYARIAQWDGAQWQSLGSGANSDVLAMARDAQGDLIVSGDFVTISGVSALRVARWDGTAWNAMGNGFSRIVHSLVLHQGEIYAGGGMEESIPPFIREFARWDGTQWTSGALQPGIVAAIFALASNGTDLIGGFGVGRNQPASLVRRLDGMEWADLTTGINSALFDVVTDNAGTLYASGLSTRAGNVEANFIAQWDGSVWSSLANGLQGTAFAMTLDANNHLIVGGSFQIARNDSGFVFGNRIVRWDGTQWHPFGDGVNSIVRAVAWHDGNLVVGGQFSEAGGNPALRVASWNGSGWQAFGDGLNGTVNALTTDSTGSLVAAGSFTQSGSTPLARIARWDGASWTALGSGMDGPVSALIVDSNGDLVAGGQFTTAGGVQARGIARWDGTQWHRIGNPGDDFGSASFEGVFALEIDATGRLLAGGDFDTVGPLAANNFARWTGSEWEAIDGGMNGSVQALWQESGGPVFAGGRFTFAGATGAPRLSGLGTVIPTMISLAPAVVVTRTATLTAQVESTFAPTSGTVSITGLPAGVCTAVTLTPVSATGSQAQCNLTDLPAAVYLVTARYSGATDMGEQLLSSTSAPVSFEIGLQQTISFADPSDLTFSPAATFSVSATATSGLPVTFSSGTPSVCTVDSNLVTVIQGGTCQIFADQSGDFDYLPAPRVEQSVIIAPAMQTISFDDPGDQEYAPSGQIALNASSTSGLPIVFESLSLTTCSVDGNTAIIVSAGTCSLRASSPGDASYLPAEAFQDVDIAPAMQTITFEDPVDQEYVPNGQLALTASSTSGLPIAFESLSTSVCTVMGSAATIVSTGTCSLRASSPGDGNYVPAEAFQEVDIAQAMQTITFDDPADLEYAPAGQIELMATANSGLQIAFESLSLSVCTVAGSTATILSVGTCALRASSPGDTNYLPAEAFQEVEITPAMQTITFNDVDDRAYVPGDIFDVTATASSGLPVTLESLAPAVCSVNGDEVTVLGAGTCELEANQAGNGNYLPASETDSVTIFQAEQTIVVVDPGGLAFSLGESFNLSVSATSGLTVETVSLTPDLCSIDAMTVTMLSVGACQLESSQPGNSNYLAAPIVVTTVDLLPNRLFRDGFEG